MSSRFTFFLPLLALLALLPSAFSDTHAKRGHVNRMTRNHREVSSARRSNVNSTLSDPEKRGLAQFSWFHDGLGACGTTNSPDDFIVAINVEQWDGGSHCYEYITITIDGKSTQAQIVDECMNCPYDALDFSTGLFTYFSDLGQGYLYGEWSYNSGSSTTTTSTWHTTSTTSTTSTTKTSTRHSTTSSTTSTSTTSTSTSSSSSSTSSSSSATSVTSLSSTVSSTATSASTSATPSTTASADSGSGDETFDSGTLTQFSLALIHLAGIADAGLVVSLGS